MSAYKYTVERDSLRERERQARAQMSSQGSDLQEDLFRPPVRVSPAATDRVTQQIQSKLGDFRYVKHFLDDPTSSIGVYGEPASPAPGGPSRGVEFKKPHYASSQNGRPSHRGMQIFGKMPDGRPLNIHQRPAPPNFHNGKTPPGVGEPNGVPSVSVETILQNIRSAVVPPLTAIAATPRKEPESMFNFNIAMHKMNNDTAPQTNGPQQQKPPTPNKQHLDRHTNPNQTTDNVYIDLEITDSEDEKRKSSSVMTSDPPAASSTGSESSSSDSDSDTSSHSGEDEPVCSQEVVNEEPPQVVEGPGEELPGYQGNSWSLSRFAPQPPTTTPLALSQTHHNTDDSCYDSLKVESVLAAAKASNTLLSGLSSDESSDAGSRKDVRNHARIPNRNIGSSSERRGRPVRTPARAPPPSSPSEDEGPPRRGRPRKSSKIHAKDTSLEGKRRGRGRPPKAKPVPPRPSSSDDSDENERPPSSPTPHVWPTTDSEGEEYPAVPTDKKKNDTLRKLFCPSGGAKGGGKGGGKGGKGKGQVLIIDHSIESEKEEDSLQRRLKEEEAFRKQREEEALRKLKEEEEATRRKQEEEALQKRLKEEAIQRRRDEEALQRRLKDEEIRRKMKEEEAIQKRLKEEEILRIRRKEEEAMQRRIKEEEHQRRLREEEKRREEVIQRRLREDLEQRRIKEEESLQRKMKEEELSHRRFKEEDSLQRRLIKEEAKSEDEDILLCRIREDGARLRQKGEDVLGGCISASGTSTINNNTSVLVKVDLSRLSSSCLLLLRRGKRTNNIPPAPPDKKAKLSHSRQNAESTPTNHERSDVDVSRSSSGQQLTYYSYLERGHQDCSSDEESSRDHKYYLLEAQRLRKSAEVENDLLGRVMLYQESVLFFVLTGRVLELELDTKKAFIMYRDTLELIKSINSLPARHRASPQSSLSKLDILSMRCQALLYLRMFKMYKGEVKEYYRIYQDYMQQKPASLDAVGTVSPLSPTPSPAGSVGSVGSAGSSGYGSAAPALTPQHSAPPSTQGPLSSQPPTSSQPLLAVPQSAHNAMVCLTKYYSFLHVSHDLWEQADSHIRLNRFTDFFVAVDRACGPLTLQSSFRHLVKYVRYAISLLKAQSRLGS